MFKRTAADARWSVLICLFVLALITAVIVVPKQFGTQAAGNSKEVVGQTDALGDNGLPNYDIRLQSDEQMTRFLQGARQLAGRNAADVVPEADYRDGDDRARFWRRDQGLVDVDGAEDHPLLR